MIMSVKKHILLSMKKRKTCLKMWHVIVKLATNRSKLQKGRKLTDLAV